MVKSEEITRKGIVIEALPNTMFRIQFDDADDLEEASIVLLSGRMRKFRIRILVGDKVDVRVDPYGGKGMIIKRL